MKKKVQKNKEKRVQKVDKKAIFWGILAALALAVVIVFIVVLNQEEPIDEGYFKTDETKIVMTMDDEMASFEDSEYEPGITHVVYLHDGNKITGVKVYYEYETDEEAGVAYDNLAMDYFVSKRRNGRYIVLQARGDEYEGLTVEQIERQFENMKAAGALIVEEVEE